MSGGAVLSAGRVRDESMPFPDKVAPTLWHHVQNCNICVRPRVPHSLQVRREQGALLLPPADQGRQVLPRPGRVPPVRGQPAGRRLRAGLRPESKCIMRTTYD